MMLRTRYSPRHRAYVAWRLMFKDQAETLAEFLTRDEALAFADGYAARCEQWPPRAGDTVEVSAVGPVTYVLNGARREAQYLTRAEGAAFRDGWERATEDLAEKDQGQELFNG